MSDDLDLGPSVLAPLPPDRSLWLGRVLLGPLTILSLAIILIFYVLYTPNLVDGDSMYPTLHNSDRVLVTKGVDRPEYDQVVVLDVLNPRTGETERLIKRIIALPGDTVAVEAGVATVNGRPEPSGRFITDPRDMGIRGSYVVPPDTVFVMGDNRPVSLDSRQLGPIRLSAIEGRVAWIWAPINRVGKVY